MIELLVAHEIAVVVSDRTSSPVAPPFSPASPGRSWSLFEGALWTSLLRDVPLLLWRPTRLQRGFLQSRAG